MSDRQRSTEDYYDTLGVPRDATTDEVKKAFRKLARACHPDVAGDDPHAQARFTEVREAYETLVDPVRRATYDRRGYATFFSGPGRQGGKWRPPGGFDFEQVGHKSAGRRKAGGQRRGRRNPANDIGLEDIFGDFGGLAPGQPGAPKASAANRATWDGSGGGQGAGGAAAGSRGRAGAPGRDIHIRVDVSASIADLGGTVTLRYPRLRRADDGRGRYRYDEIYDLRVPPGVKAQDRLRVPGFGDAGAPGGTDGDLVCELTRVADGYGQEEQPVRRGSRHRHRPDPAPSGAAEGPRAHAGNAPRSVNSSAAGGPGASAGSEAPAHDDQVVRISIVEALLGGRVRVETPAGAVHITIPPCTSSGTRLRLRGRGRAGRDHYAELRIITPERLDGESRALIERFAELNPMGPRDDQG